MTELWRWRAFVPAVILVLVGSVQITLTRSAGLTPWKGGGFGMFSTTDDAAHRTLRIFVSASERSEELEITDSLTDAAIRAAVLPSDRQLTNLAQLVVARERRHARPVETIRIECWRTEYDVVTLAATSRRHREFVYRVDSRSARR